MGAEGTREAHILHGRDILMRTAFCEACGKVDIVYHSRWRCGPAWRAGQNARKAAKNEQIREGYQRARRTLATYLTQHGLPDADKIPDFTGMTEAQADWLYWVARAGVEAIAERHDQETTMTDTTAQGHEAEPTDVEALLNNLCCDIYNDPDPLTRYLALTSQQVLLDAVVSAIKVRRGVEMRAMADSGLSYEQIARATGLGGKQRVSQLIAPAA